MQYVQVRFPRKMLQTVLDDRLLLYCECTEFQTEDQLKRQTHNCSLARVYLTRIYNIRTFLGLPYILYFSPT